jgi:hypothetical protein
MVTWTPSHPLWVGLVHGARLCTMDSATNHRLWHALKLGHGARRLRTDVCARRLLLGPIIALGL